MRNVVNSPGGITPAALTQFCSVYLDYCLQASCKHQIDVTKSTTHAGGDTGSELASNAVLRVRVRDPRLAKLKKGLAGAT